MERGSHQGNIYRSGKAWPGFWRVQRILMEEQERGRSIRVEGACAKIQGLLPTCHPPLLCWQHLGSLRSRMIKGKKLKACGSFQHLPCGSREVWRFQSKKWLLDTPTSSWVTKFGKQLLEFHLTPGVYFWSPKSLFFELQWMLSTAAPFLGMRG